MSTRIEFDEDAADKLLNEIRNLNDEQIENLKIAFGEIKKNPYGGKKSVLPIVITSDYCHFFTLQPNKWVLICYDIEKTNDLLIKIRSVIVSNYSIRFIN